ncbi:UDP-glucose dehydrogenase family protein [Paenibacillus crassostreae]|uniref:UDP-glucose 6-dehydrogenase n=1 Tax=Paenibacillus crassostreae TaxID=1763538 RepID=A0A167D8U4_9BACL|nr:UDP-glucose/GDP-mannose dehydrogenase family protein [Paenibacillus crassostreae]AOZ93256.1 UDP-glucose 6-dehydrogenase [Paenibacillus crassostreae]OAB74079.1 UDP-glucose 6-dehydrogenase [Paenibacillus crassostreae]
MNYKITVFGLGFVGLTTALAFAEKGHKTYGIDVNQDRLNMIKSGKLPFVEPGLDDALLRHINNNFEITNEAKAAVIESDFIFLCVGTPAGENGEADLRYIYSAIDMFSSLLNNDKYRTIVIKSTIPPSTTSERIIPYLKSKELNPGDLFSIANNPEFLREGKCWDDMINADRIVCGVSDSRGEDMLRSLYSRFEAPFFAVSLNTGEFIKYLSNSLLATMISYANEMSKIADVIGDIELKDAFEILHLDRRWGGASMASYVYPGCGYGGYCLPKDTQALYAKSLSKGYEPGILKNVIEVNSAMPQFMADKIMLNAQASDNIGILGLSFKPGSDDVRDSSAAKIIKLLLASGYKKIYSFDPIANKGFAEEYDLDITYCSTKENLCEIADVLVLVTAWDEFAGIKTEYPLKRMIDCRYYL